MRRKLTPQEAETFSWAAANGRTDTLRSKLGEGLSPDAVGKINVTALYYACANGHIDAVRLLLDAGANPNRIVAGTPSRGRQAHEITTALAGAIEGRHTDVIDLLLARGANPAVQDVHHETGAHLFLAQCIKLRELPGGEDYINRTLECMFDRADIINQGNRHGETPLHTAIIFGPLPISTYALLIRRGADIARIDGEGRQPLHRAAMSGDVEVMNFLVDSGAEVDAVDWADRTPLFLASGTDACQTLLALGADRRRLDVFGGNALASRMRRMTKMAGLGQEVPFLLEAGLDPDDKDYAGVSARDIAHARKLTEVKEYLAGALARRAVAASQTDPPAADLPKRNPRDRSAV